MPVSPSCRTRLTPADTTRSASMSRPESVSSRIAIFGLSSSSWTISWRFFSPPEKPSLTLRWANAGSMPSRSIADLSSAPHVRSLGACPSSAAFAVRKKLATETPGTSTGYCIARNSPGPLVDGHRQHVLAGDLDPVRSAVVRRGGRIMVEEGHRAAGDLVPRVPRDGVGERGLARPVGAHDGVGLPGPHGQVDPGQDRLALVVGQLDRDLQVTDFQDTHAFTPET